ncbi:MAG: DUF4433 domain-containing protein [Proteobacteria bacterium]|nr:MAG: DUF4433 domain-containing protein [Pseudomonadota bacterium]
MAQQIKEFQSIMPLENVPSVIQCGILSHEQMAKYKHHSVAMQEIQDRRNHVRIPGGLMLHQYANLYFHARNPMMYKLHNDAKRLSILRVSIEARHIEGAVIADRNASADFVQFLAIEQTHKLDLEAVYARNWTHPDDPIAYRRHKAQKCAEFLVPHRLPPEFITGAYVVNEVARNALLASGFSLPIQVEPDLFFH